MRSAEISQPNTAPVSSARLRQRHIPTGGPNLNPKGGPGKANLTPIQMTKDETKRAREQRHPYSHIITGNSLTQD